MSGIKAVKNRIKSVQDTGKITNAMYLISSTKLQKARKELDNTRPYFDFLRRSIKRMFRRTEALASPYFFEGETLEDDPDETYAVLAITGDKGMAGAYNQNVLKEVEKIYSAHKKSRFFMLGEFGRKALASKGIPYEKDLLYTAQRPTLKTARAITYMLLDLYDRKEISRIYIIYTDMKTALLEVTNNEMVLPFRKESFDSAGDDYRSDVVFEFVPSVEEVLRNIAYSYLTGFVYSALVDSFCCEQNARMTAMRSANDNAKSIESELQLLYNSMRQSEITNEIIEVSSGAKAQALHNKKHK